MRMMFVTVYGELNYDNKTTGTTGTKWGARTMAQFMGLLEECSGREMAILRPAHCI